MNIYIIVSYILIFIRSIVHKYECKLILLLKFHLGRYTTRECLCSTSNSTKIRIITLTYVINEHKEQSKNGQNDRTWSAVIPKLCNWHNSGTFLKCRMRYASTLAKFRVFPRGSSNCVFFKGDKRLWII